jgi:AcrR family transcriptional regulator
VNAVPEGRRQAQRDRMRARLLTAALHLFAKNGYEATTIDQIAEQADVARQTVLNHYPHKRDFVRAWGQRRRDQLLDLADHPEPDEPARAQLHRFYAALAQMNEREHDLTRMLHLHDQVLVYERPVPEAVLAAIHRGRDRGEFNPGLNPYLAAEVLTAVYFDTLGRWLAEAEPPFDLSGMLADKLDLVMTGLAVR